jgi:hypothetical protein
MDILVINKVSIQIRLGYRELGCIIDSLCDELGFASCRHVSCDFLYGQCSIYKDKCQELWSRQRVTKMLPLTKRKGV